MECIRPHCKKHHFLVNAPAPVPSPLFRSTSRWSPTRNAQLPALRKGRRTVTASATARRAQPAMLHRTLRRRTRWQRSSNRKLAAAEKAAGRLRKAELTAAKSNFKKFRLAPDQQLEELVSQSIHRAGRGLQELPYAANASRPKKQRRVGARSSKAFSAPPNATRAGGSRKTKTHLRTS